jgi:hypothetical protein
MSVLVASLLNIDRWLALYFGIRYYVRVTSRKIKIVVLLMPMVCALITYLSFYNENGSLGIQCDSLINRKNSTVNIIGKLFFVVIGILNIVIYAGIVSMLKFKDQLDIVVKVSMITGSVILLCTPGLAIFIFFPNSEDRSLYLYAALPVIVKSLLNPFIYVWRFADPRYQLKKVICFWNKRAVAGIELERKNYYSSYRIGRNTVNRSSLTLVL